MHGTAVRSGLIASLLAFASSAQAVNLSVNGIGQTLVYPYYTVNAGQQTLFSIVNTSSVGKAAKVRLREAYNGREVLDFNVFLSAHDVWTANVFKLSDAAVAGDGAAIFSNDASCIAPNFRQGQLPNGASYQALVDYLFTAGVSDTGPTSDSRTNEGFFEVIAMADVVAGGKLDADITHVNGVAPGCANAEADFESGDGSVAPTSGLFGSVSIVKVEEGTFYAYNAEALDGFTSIRLNSALGSDQPTLASANDPCCGSTVTARQFLQGDLVASVFPKERAIDAVSTVFSADAIYNEYVATSAAGTDWVVTFPTKQFYVDPRELPPDQRTASPPFAELFGTTKDPGKSCVLVLPRVFDREGATPGEPCGLDPCPVNFSGLCLETNVLRFGPTSVLGSELGSELSVSGASAGMLQLNLDIHGLTLSANGNAFHGLPVVGFAVTKYVNGALQLSGGGQALANYTNANRHRTTTNCSSANGPCS